MMQFDPIQSKRDIPLDTVRDDWLAVLNEAVLQAPNSRKAPKLQRLTDETTGDSKSSFAGSCSPSTRVPEVHIEDKFLNLSTDEVSGDLSSCNFSRNQSYTNSTTDQTSSSR